MQNERKRGVDMIPNFRAFLKDTKKIVDVAMIFFEIGIVKLTNNEFYEFDDIIIMQSTGLHDEQGVEIFEGDIVEIIYDSEPFTGVVVYDLGEADFKATNNHEDYGNNFQYLTVGESIEVIGNIYQNPELLEVV